MAHIIDPDAVWLSWHGRRLNTAELRKVLERLCRDAAISGNRPPHAFRHGYVTQSYRANPESIRVLAARMGWPPKSHRMIDTYTMGAVVDLARTRPLPSISRQWRGDAPAPAAPFPQTQAQTTASNKALSPELIAAVRTNPELVRALLQALHGAA